LPQVPVDLATLFGFRERGQENKVISDDSPALQDLSALVRETQALWNAKAEYWDARMGDGNAFQRILLGPACDNGVFARRLAELGARVMAVDFSERFLELARARSASFGDRIEYLLVDATDDAQLLALGEHQFDAVICNMALMDMPVIDPLLRAVRRLLAPGGRFVFSVQHPAFNSNAIRLCLEEDGQDGSLMYSIKVTGYLRVPPGKGAGMPGEPVPHWYFHRPLSELLGACFAAGFVLDGLEEPAFRPEDATPGTLSWLNFTEIPPVLVARLRPAG
jgi:SAM-dependent methyltransferase